MERETYKKAKAIMEEREALMSLEEKVNDKHKQVLMSELLVLFPHVAIELERAIIDCNTRFAEL